MPTYAEARAALLADLVSTRTSKMKAERVAALVVALTDPLSGDVESAVARLDAILAGANQGVDTFIEAYNRFLTDESAAAALTAQVNDKQAASANLTAIAALAPAAGKLLVGTAGGWALLDASGIANDWAFVRDSTAASGFKFAAVSGGASQWTTGAGGAISYSSGHIGVGTTNDMFGLGAGAMTLDRAAGGQISFGYNGAPRGYVRGSTSGFEANAYLLPLYLQTVGAHDIILRPDTTEAMRIKVTTNYVGIGTTSPAEKLDVAGNIKLSGSIKFNDGTTQSTAAGITRVESSQLSITASSTLTLAHGLGAAPKRFGAYAVCLTAQAPFAVGDRIMIATDNGYSECTTVYANATTVGVIVPDHLYAGSGLINMAGNANFALVLWAEK